MCDPVSPHDSRGGGFYCCKCNKYIKEAGTCCKKHRRKKCHGKP